MSELLIIRAPHQQESAVSLNGEPVVIGSNRLRATSWSTIPPSCRTTPIIAKDAGHWRVATYDAEVPLTYDNQPTIDLRLENGTRFTIGQTQFELARDDVPANTRADARQASPRSEIPPRLPLPQPQRRPLARTPSSTIPRLPSRICIEAMQRIRAEMARVVIGQSEVVNQILVALFARGHCLLVGTPGLAKTLMARTLADSLELDCKRVQFTPDLMPADITGTQVLEQDPVDHFANAFSNSSRGPSSPTCFSPTKSTARRRRRRPRCSKPCRNAASPSAAKTYDLPEPFFVIATQNPIEQEGTYPLPEAQLDRFMFSVRVGYPSADEEERIIMETTQDASQGVDRVLAAAALIDFQHLVRKTPVSKHVGAYATRLVRATRPEAPDAPDFIKNWVRWGAGPRAGQYLLLAAKSHALLQGRLNVSCDDIRAYALPVLRHRVLCNFAAASEGVDSDEIVRRLLAAVPEPDYAK